MNITAALSTLSSVQSEVIGIYAFQTEKDLKTISKELSLPPLKDFSGKDNESLLLYPALHRSRVFIVGLGDEKKFTLEKLRRASAAIAKKAQSLKAKSVSILFPALDISNPTTPEEISTAIVEGCLLSLYKFDKYITKEKKNKNPQSLSIVSLSKVHIPKINAGIDRGIALCVGTIHARNLENAPSNEIYPETLAKDARQLAKSKRFSITIFDKRKIKSLGMGGVIGVSKGSINDPRFIIMEYGSSYKKNGTVALVGKGVTFDSGGISIKPSANMGEMKMDMSGAAAVIGTFHSVAALKLKKHVIGIIPSVENMPSGSAIKPGDIIKHFNGKTSEVDNTDAEGRLILADALSYVSKYKPDIVIDLATLTGACVVALGAHATGMMGNDQKTMQELTQAGEKTYERVWQLPLFEEYEKQIHSDVADVKNVGGRWAGAITAGLFLKNFIGNYKWVHLDIAGTAILEESKEYIPRGGSGVGVRLLTEFIANWKK